MNTALTRLLTRLSLFLLFYGVGYAHAVEPSYVLYNYNQNSFLAYRNTEQVRSIASITKLMTAIVVIESGADLDQKVNGLQSRLRSKSVTRLDLMRSMLIASDNGAAESLADAYSGNRQNFINMMNFTAIKYQLSNTRYVDPTGLGEGNKSTILDLIKLLKVASEKDLIRQISTKTEYKFSIPIQKKTKTVLVHNTNRTSLFTYDNIVLTKTGFTNPAGRCVAMLVEKNKELYAVVILGEPSIQKRWAVIQNLMDYFKDNELHIYGTNSN